MVLSGSGDSGPRYLEIMTLPVAFVRTLDLKLFLAMEHTIFALGEEAEAVDDLSPHSVFTHPVKVSHGEDWLLGVEAAPCKKCRRFYTYTLIDSALLPRGGQFRKASSWGERANRSGPGHNYQPFPW